VRRETPPLKLIMFAFLLNCFILNERSCIYKQSFHPGLGLKTRLFHFKVPKSSYNFSKSTSPGGMGYAYGVHKSFFSMHGAHQCYFTCSGRMTHAQVVHKCIFSRVFVYFFVLWVFSSI